MASELYNRVMEQLNKKDKIREYVYLKVYEDADIFTHSATDYDDILFELLEKMNIGDINAMNTNHVNLL